jgi:glycogen debranching enzyme
MKYNTIDEVIEAAYAYLDSHLVQGERWGLPFYFYKPANTKYGAHQWLWDSGWHMIVWSRRNPENAIKDLRTMLQFQQPNGFIPEMIFWGQRNKLEKISNFLIGYSNPKYTDISQMPMLGYSVRSIFEATNNIELLKEFVPKIVHYLEWWHNERDTDKDGLISIIHPWESGLDASPVYDPAHGVDNPVYKELYPKFLKLLYKYRKKAKWDIPTILREGWFNFEDVGLCAVYTDAWGIMAKLAALFDTSLADKCKKMQFDYEQKIIKKCWDPTRKQFISFYHQGDQEKPSYIRTIQSLFPLLFESLPKEIEHSIIETLKDPEHFWLEYPVPTTAKSEITFNPHDSRLMWRGPTWGSTNWIVVEALLKKGYKFEARAIVDKWLEMTQKHGFWEYHNPITGEAEGQEGLGMSTTLIDMLYRCDIIPK